MVTHVTVTMIVAAVTTGGITIAATIAVIATTVVTAVTIVATTAIIVSTGRTNTIFIIGHITGHITTSTGRRTM